MSTEPPSETQQPQQGGTGNPPGRLNSAANLISAAAAVGGLLLGFLGLPAAGVNSPTTTTPRPTVTVTQPAPTVTVSAPAGADTEPSSSAPSGQSATTDLRDLSPIAGSEKPFVQGAAALKGKSYDSVLTAYPCPEDWNPPRQSVYNLGSGYKRLTGLLGLDDNSPEIGVDITIYGDSQRLQTTHLNIGTTVPVDLDVSGVLRLKVVYQMSLKKPGLCGGSPMVAFANAQLRTG
ncbi:NPCBM/NEW2 domain-containing protein [Streptomyces sp. NPDC006662]|uniref:NPCBM/NEW2 domain-containing protein n=1 Tax=Streptomyces sp. NPDC006662 TaxID=3156902 RepID=UPI0033CF41E4